MKIVDLYSGVYVYRLRKKRHLYLTRSKAKKLRKVIANDHMYETIMHDNAVAVFGRIPERADEILVNEFGFHTRYNKVRDMSLILPCW